MLLLFAAAPPGPMGTIRDSPAFTLLSQREETTKRMRRLVPWASVPAPQFDPRTPWCHPAAPGSPLGTDPPAQDAFALPLLCALAVSPPVAILTQLLSAQILGGINAISQVVQCQRLPSTGIREPLSQQGDFKQQSLKAQVNDI